MRALITGGTRGIGLACCRLFFRMGFEVVALYSSDESAAQTARKELPDVCFLRADVSDEQRMREVFAEIGPIDVLVNNAGIDAFAQVQDMSYSDYHRVMDVNMGGTFLATKFAVPAMLSRGGAIVNVSSVWGVQGGSCESVYSASKGAMIAFTKALSMELAPAVRVNAIAPGAIDTVMNACYTPEERAEIENRIPLGRFGTPEEVAEAVYFLATCRYVTGQVLGVDGGGI